VQEVLLYSQFTERKEWERGGFGSWGSIPDKCKRFFFFHSLLRGRNEKGEGPGAEVRFQTSARGSSLFTAYWEEGTRKGRVRGLRFDSRQVQEVLLYSELTERKEWERGGFGSWGSISDKCKKFFFTQWCPDRHWNLFSLLPNG
jgi:hypothetical protein